MDTLAAALSSAMTTRKPASDAMPAADQHPAWYPDINLDGDTTGTIRAAADAAAAIVAEMRANAAPRWLTLTGLQGTGKTMLARQIFAESQSLNPGAASLWIGDRRRPRCVWLDETDFAEAVMADARLPEYLAGDYLVILDDLGSARERWDRVADALFRLANARLGRWTIWTSNLTHREISDSIDARLASRLIRDGNKGVRITAPDYALRNRKIAA